MIGKRLWIGIPEAFISPETHQHLLSVKPGGVILFARNIVSIDQLKQLIMDLRSLLGSSLVIAIDQEGGRVVRIEDGVTVFPGNLALGAAALNDRPRTLELARLQGRISGRELREIGIDVNLSPCVDLLRSRDGRGIGSRSFGSDPQLTLELASEIGAGHRQQGVHDCWKHFPGIGRATVDPHFGLPRISGLDGADHLIPFRAASHAGASMVMTSHVIAEALDQENPVTTSRAAVTDHLRGEMGFSGVILTDCLEMGGVSGFDFEQVVISAITAGHDAVLVSHTPELQMRARQVLEEHVASDPRFDQAHQESLQRLDDLSAFSEFDPAQMPSPVEVGTEVADEIARSGTTLLSGPAARIEGEGKWLLVLPALQQRSPVEDPLRGEDLSLLADTLEQYLDCMRIDADPTPGEIEQVIERAAESAGVILGLQGFRHCDAARELVQTLADRSLRLIVVLLEDPRDLVAVPAADKISVISSHGFRPVHQQAIAAALLGEFEPCGRSPVEFS